MCEITHLHCHDDKSNAGGYFEVVTRTDEYIKSAVDMGMKNFCITNHGNVTNWVMRKMMAEQAGLKYIHGIEAYATDSLDEKVRDNFHITLIAKNHEGVKEINRLSSISFNRNDNHFYYRPRISFDELAATSNNIYILTACLGSPLYQHYINENHEQLKKWISFFVANKHRVWLEVQPHIHDEQKVYNKFLLAMAKKYDMNIVATNDVHTLDSDSGKLRQVMKKAKKVKKAAYEDEDDFELWFKSRSAMEETFRLQGVLNEDQIKTAIDNTNVIADSIEDFELDKSFKFPQMHEDPVGKIKELIVKGYKDRGIFDKPIEEQKVYKQRVLKELGVFIETGSVNYMLLEYEVKLWGRENNIFAGYGRGSAGGSLISYLLHVTELDSVKLGLDFERFMNIERVSLPDIDSDYYGADRFKVHEYLLTHDTLKCASIMTVNTFGVKGAVKAIGRGLENSYGELIYSLDDINNILSQVIEDGTQVYVPEFLKEEHPQLFHYVDQLVGVTESFGRHAAGVIVSTENIDEEFGTMSISKWDYKVSQINMKEVDKLNYVKLDVLAIDTLEIINRTAKFANLPRPTPDSDWMNFEDPKIWQSAAEDNSMLFQFTEKRAGKILSDILSETTLNRVKEKNGSFKYIDLVALASAAQRPSGESYVENVQNGIFADNGHEALDNLFKDTMGYMVFQEQLTKFLVEVCGWSMAHSDLIRRGIGKKNQAIMDEEVPKIKPSFIKTMVDKYGDTQEHAENVADSFIQVFMDAVNYGFNKSHAVGYAYLTAAQAWLRYYYPLEFCTVALDIYKDNQAKTKSVLDFAEKHNITVDTAKFRYSKGDYFFNKDTNTIYQGTAPIKQNNAETGDMLYDLRDRNYSSFSSFLLEIYDGSTLKIDDAEYPIEELLLKDPDEVKTIDKQYSDGLKYSGDYTPTREKTVVTALNKWIEKNPNDEFTKEYIEKRDEYLLEGKDFSETDEYVQLVFGWIEENFNGKRPWENATGKVSVVSNPLSINKAKMEGLIKLDYFSEFGGSKGLMEVYSRFRDEYKPKNKAFKGKAEKYKAIKQFENEVAEKQHTTIEQIEFQQFYTGRITAKNDKIPPKYAYVVEVVNYGKTRTTAIFYLIKNGVYQEVKVGAKLYRNVRFEPGDVVEIRGHESKAKITKIDGAWVKKEDEKELWITDMKFIRRGEKQKDVKN